MEKNNNKKSNLENQEQWLKWNPSKLPEGDYTVISFTQDLEGTKIILENEKNIVKVFFDGIILLARISDEGMRIQTVGEILYKKCDDYFFRGWFLYRIENSKLSDWVTEESGGIYNSSELIHICIVTDENVIDIISTFEPEIEITPIEQPKKCSELRS